MATAQEEGSIGDTICIVGADGVIMILAIMTLLELSRTGRWSKRTRAYFASVTVFNAFVVVMLLTLDEGPHSALTWILVICSPVLFLVQLAGLFVMWLTGRLPEGFRRAPPAPPRQPGEGMDLEEWAGCK